MIIYNCHTHIFNMECVPDRFLKWPWLYRMLLSNRVTEWLIKKLNSSQVDFLEKQAQFMKYNAYDWQELIFADLLKNYPPDARFVVLTLDMDFMGAGTPERNYLTQLHEVADLKRKYPSTLLPFLSIDPRRLSGESLVDFAARYIEDRGFHGLKMYTPLGFYPFDERLDALYKWASEKRLPILYHCHKQGGVYYKGTFRNEWLSPGHGMSFKAEPMNKFRDNFMDPKCFEILIGKFPELKICLAHFGGTYEMDKDGTGDNWFQHISKLISGKNNVYTDVSYSLWDEKHHGKIKERLADPATGAKILFGTDFYMTEKEDSEKKLITKFREKMEEPLFRKASYDNIKAFLDSEYYPFKN